MSALFNDARSGGDVDRQTRIVEEIIRAREQESNEEFPMRLESMPLALIGKIGSFLHQKAHISFTRCSRSTYCANNMPNTLQILDLGRTAHLQYQLIDVQRYAQIHCIRFTLSKFKHLSFSAGSTVFPRLRNIEITNERKADADIESLLNNKAVPWNQITHLKLSNFAKREISEPSFPKAKYTKLLMKFPNLIFLELENAYLEDIDVAEDPMWNHLLPKLKIFVDRGTTGSVADSVIRSRSKHLKMLSFSEGAHDLPEKIDLSTLIELECRSPFNAHVLDMICGLPNQLKRMAIELVHGDLEDTDFKLITHMISQHETLEELVVLAPVACLSRVCNAFERGVFDMGEAKKESLQLKMAFSGAGKWSIADLIFEVSRVLFRMYESKISDYLVSISFWRLEHHQTQQSWNEQLHKFALQIDSKFDFSFSGWNILISRKDSKLGGCIQNYISDGWLHEF